MQTRLDPKSGNQLSVLGMGCMRFPRGVTAQIDQGKVDALVAAAAARGVNYFDTAYIYGGSEEALGAALKKNHLREKVYLATKLPFRLCERFEDFDRLFHIQLSRLKTDHIDYYLIHNLPEVSLWRALCELGIERWIAEKKAGGQIRQIGFSFHGAQADFLALLDAYDWDFCQIQYNYMNINYQAGQAGLRRAHEKGLAVIVMEPLLGGRLATGLPGAAAKLFRAANAALSPAAWALNWLWNQNEVTVALSGMSSIHQLDENADIADTAAPDMFTEAENALFAPVIAAFEAAYKIPCTGCNYCMPCPQKVNIPGLFAAYNMSYAAGYISGLAMYYTGIGATDPKRNYSARNCVKCGKCERHCPQHIPIMTSLEAVTRRMEPWWIRAAIGPAMKIFRLKGRAKEGAAQ